MIFAGYTCLFFIGPAWCWHGKTIGGRLLNSQIVTISGHQANLWQLLIHYSGLYLIGLPLLFLDLWLFNRLGNVPSATLNRLDVYLVVVSVILLIISYDLLLALFSRSHQLWCEKLSRTTVK
ncbi:RDD family protein [Lactiplantibacillus plantarum]|mgnify:FL=1|uniref:RDD family protein n=1 Tax=Lactiplantibacillus TaxID=2767842 RepID=UPI001EE18424|nr:MULTISPECIES: RDD family protein [Lactiplantibacillus]MCH7257691.1 RDD family protein [Lactiplantibacillus sp. ME-2]MDN5974429.1 RDD family protein [Lactiplantibacillus plantarum]MDN5992185.1 RDD family protein [Lactiplantibacillus plantarum]MDN6213008.1 RDD family protein [Lactiplantibacillus plantarum]MDN6482796.1 RDD family protein [Lactiplantibacillus plantarum]